MVARSSRAVWLSHSSSQGGLCPEGEGSWLLHFLWRQGQHTSCLQALGLAGGLVAGWLLVGGQGLGGLSDLSPENKLLPAGLTQLR